MKKFLTILIAILAFSSVPAQANSVFEQFFKQLTGRWKIETKGSSPGGPSLTVNFTGVFSRLKDGAFYTETRGTLKGRRLLTKSWSYKNGTSRTVSFVNGRKTDDVSGTSSVKKVGSAKWITRDRYSDGTTHSGVTRKINRNKFVVAATTSDGFRSTSTYTRIGK